MAASTLYPPLTRSPVLDPQFRLGRKDDIHPGAELDQAHTLAALQSSPLTVIEDDTPRDQAGDLFERYFMPSPRTVTTFCSLRSARGRFMAFRYLPFW